MDKEPHILVGIIDGRGEVSGRLDGAFTGEGFGAMTGPFSAKAAAGGILLFDASGREKARAPEIRLAASNKALFSLFGVTIGTRFHWQRPEDQTFEGNLLFRLLGDGTMAAINEVPV